MDHTFTWAGGDLVREYRGTYPSAQSLPPSLQLVSPDSTEQFSTGQEQSMSWIVIGRVDYAVGPPVLRWKKCKTHREALEAMDRWCSWLYRQRFHGSTYSKEIDA
jgi:hypothetical protein